MNTLLSFDNQLHGVEPMALHSPLQVDSSLSILNRTGKKSFLLYKHSRYVTVATENIALFYIRYNLPVIMSFDKQEYFVNYSLEQIQQLVTESQFFRMNRQCLVNFNAVKEVEHYFARKLLVKLSIPVADKLIVSKEKATTFLRWLENR